MDLTKIIKNENANEVLSSISFTNIEQTDWNSTGNNIFIENIVKLDCETVPLEEVLLMKDAGFKYQRQNVGLSQKGKNDLPDRLFYKSDVLEDSRDIPILIGKEINEYYYSSSPSKMLRHNYKSVLRDNETTYYNQEIMRQPIKLIWRQTAPFVIGTVLDRSIFFGNTIQAGIIKEAFENKVSYKYLCGLLNSKYLRYLYEQNVKEGGRVFPQVKLEKLKPIPVVIPSPDQKSEIEELVTKIILATSNGDADTAQEIKATIDQKVFELYKVDPSSIV